MITEQATSTIQYICAPDLPCEEYWLERKCARDERIAELEKNSSDEAGEDQ